MERILKGMSTLKAIVQGGRAIIEDMGEYPDGTELELSLVADDEMDAEERAKLHAALDIGLTQAREGQTRPAEEVVAELFAKG